MGAANWLLGIKITRDFVNKTLSLKPSAIPIDPSAPREAVGSLMYAAMGTRPDIAFATSTVAQFFGTKTLELTYGGDKRGLEGYVDADGASQEHRRAISGYVFMVDGGAVSWSCCQRSNLASTSPHGNFQDH